MQSFLIKTGADFFNRPVASEAAQLILNSVNLPGSPPDPADIQIINQDQTSLKIEQVRRLITELSYKTRAATPRVFILWRADLLTIPAQNALLKSLEEPPANTYLMLVTDQPEALLPTIRSRCSTIVMTDPTASTSVKSSSSEQLLAILTNSKTSYSELIDLAAKYSNRDQAATLVSQLIEAIHDHPDYPNPASIKNLQILLQTQTDLKANVNVKLAMEECFFLLKKPILTP